MFMIILFDIVHTVHSIKPARFVSHTMNVLHIFLPTIVHFIMNKIGQQPYSFILITHWNQLQY